MKLGGNGTSDETTEEETSSIIVRNAREGEKAT